MQLRQEFIIKVMMMLILLISAVVAEETADEKKLRAKADQLAQEFLMLDGHIDIPYRLNKYPEDISQRTPGGDFDYQRAKSGGLNAPFMSIYVPAEHEKKGIAKTFADTLITMVEGFHAQWPDKFAVARTVADVRRHFAAGKISLPMGMENGAPIEGDLDNLEYFYQRGIRYITLTHSKSNHICDSSYDEERPWQGLSPFGEEVVQEMNRLGMIIDVSHVSDSAFYDVMQLSEAPVWASHSSCRAFTEGWERNMSDKMIKLLAEKDGVICINFGSSFLRTEFLSSWTTGQQAINKYLTENNIERNSQDHMAFYNKYRQTNPVGTIEDVIAHIDHVVKLVGVDHVAFGSDFDGVFHLPKGIQDVSEYPNIVYHLLKAGYSEDDIKKICGENMMRVWSAVEKTAMQLQAK